MKKTSLLFVLAGMLITALASPVFAADSKEVSITGEAKCAKCALHEGDKCQGVIQTQEGGKTVSYYLAKNKVSDAFHETICQESHKVTATGKLKESDGKKILTASKIELAK